MKESRLSTIFRLGGHALLAVAILILMPVEPASAKDLKGRLGLGVEQTLGGVTGITLRYWPGQAFGLSLTIGAELTSFTTAVSSENGADDAAAEATESRLGTTIKASLGFTYNLARSIHANFGIGARVALGFRNESASLLQDVTGTADALQWSVEIPVTVEFFFSDHFSASLAMGFVFAFIPKEGAVLKAPGQGETQKDTSLLVKFGGGGGVGGTLGIVYYF